jgi:sugar lactone lactonase YvrE
MKRKILALNFIWLIFIFFNCDENTFVETYNQNNIGLNKKTAVVTIKPILDLNKSSNPDFPPAAPGDSPEGIAIDKQGNMYVSNTRGIGQSINEILKVNTDGSYSVFTTLPGQGHATGLVTDKNGNVYVAFYVANDLTRNGVYKIDKHGLLERLSGSENIGRPNALTFDAKGYLYCTSSFGEGSELEGAIWKYGKDRIFKRWFMDQCLDASPHPVAGVLPGANGIVFYPPNKLYVANTSQSSISCLKITDKGESARVKWSKNDFLFMNIDGIAADIHENIYGVLPVSTLSNLPSDGPPPMPPVVVLNTKTQEVIPIVDPADATSFNTPTSITFGTGGSWDRKSVFIANAGLFYGQSHEPWSNPGVVEVSIGIPGKPGK